MKNIYGNDGPVILAEDGKFEVIGQVGNKLSLKKEDGSIVVMEVTGSNGSSFEGKSEGGDEPGPIPPIAAYTFRVAFDDPNEDRSWSDFWTKVENYPGYANVWDAYNESNPSEWSDIFAYDETPYTIIEVGNCEGMTVVDGAFTGNRNMKGLLVAYNKLSNTSSITSHSGCFGDAGTRTAEGMAERAQIPEDWGGDMS